MFDLFQDIGCQLEKGENILETAKMSFFLDCYSTLKASMILKESHTRTHILWGTVE